MGDSRSEAEKEEDARDIAEANEQTLGEDVADRWIPPNLDWSTVDNDEVVAPETRLKELDTLDAFDKPATTVQEEPSAGTQFATLYDKLAGTADDVAPNHVSIWAAIAEDLSRALTRMHSALGRLEDADNFAGETADAARANIHASLAELNAAATGARVMSVIVDAFSRTMSSTKQQIVSKWDEYNQQLDKYPLHQDEIKQGFDSYAQQVINVAYNPGIREVAAKDPKFTTGTTPTVGAPGTSPAPRGISSGGSSGGGPGGLSPSGAGTPALNSALQDWAAQIPEAANAAQQPPGSAAPSMPDMSGLTGAASAPAEAAKGAGSAAKDALGKATDALGQALNAATGGKPALPEGVLGLGPRGLTDAVKAAGAGGAKGTGAGGGSGAGGVRDPGRPAGAPVAAAGKGPEAATASSRAGLGGASGAPGAGAPAAGQRGGAEGKEHKVHKVLRRRRTGQEVIGESDAVVAVVGEESPSEADKRSSK